jgi:hypothetical protein
VLPPNTTIQKDAVLAIQKAATVFISYLSSQYVHSSPSYHAYSLLHPVRFYILDRMDKGILQPTPSTIPTKNQSQANPPPFSPSANDATLKRTVAPADVFNALSELELDSFRPRLEQELEAYTEIKAGKRKTKKTDANGNAGEGDSTAAAGGSASRDEDEDVEMVDNPAKRVKRDGDEVGAAGAGGQVDGDETQEEDEEEGEDEEEEEEGESEEDQDEDEDDDDGRRGDEDVDRVEDLDAAPRRMDPDADETDDDDGPASQLRDDLGLG